ncbi:hypothetical protein MRX96_049476, partial [Rhipicephalus microplus]
MKSPLTWLPPDNSCEGVITGAFPIPTEDALMNDTVTYPQSINIIQARPFGTNGACLYTFEGMRVPRYVYFQGVKFRCRPFRPVTQVCHCCLRTGHQHDICPYSQERRCGNCGIVNPSEHHDGCVPRCLTCGSDEHPTIDLGDPAQQSRPGPHVLRDERQFLEQPNDPPLKQLSEQLPPNNQPRSRPQHASSEGHGICVFIQELPTAFFALQCEKLQYVASTPATRAHPCTWLGGQGSGLEFIWLGCRRSPRSSPKVAATATAGSLAVPEAKPDHLHRSTAEKLEALFQRTHYPSFYLREQLSRRISLSEARVQ